MERAAGSRFGPYEIVSPLGSGGMGEVYRATDTRLHRDVALKLLTGVEADDSRRQRRFLQEARAASALKHPNILSVFDIGNENGTQYIVSELVDGESLRALIQKGPMPLRRFLEIAVQVASGLTAAHEAGIVHRDLKPENIMVGRDNHVKILDFGLAKVVAPEVGTPEEQTRSQMLTHPGAIMGTVAYMSPEQARGEEVDFRADQFSFGLILYEMATGKQAFHKNTPVQTMSAIITEDPPSISTLNRKFPTPLRWMIERCLAKDSRDRYGATIDLYYELRNFKERLSEGSYSGETGAPVVVRRQFRTRLLVALLAVAAVAAGFVLAALLVPREEVRSDYHFSPLAVNPEYENFAVWSPDGKSVAYVSETRGVLQLFVRNLASPTPVQLTDSTTDVISPYWHPDGSRIYYTSGNEKKKESFNLWAVSLAGGGPQLVLADAGGGAISRDGRNMAVFRSDEKQGGGLSLWLSSPPGAPPVRYRHGSLGTSSYGSMEASFSPDSTRLLVVSKEEKVGLNYWLIPLPDGEPQSLSFMDSVQSLGVSWLPDSRRFVVSAMYPDHQTPHLWLIDPERKSRQPITSGILQEWAPDVSPDGRRIVFASVVQQYDLMEVPLDGGPMRNLTSTPINEKAPAWSRNGGQFAFASDITGSDVVWVRSQAEGWQRPLVTAKDFPDQHTISFSRPFFSPDGQRVVYHRNTSAGMADIWISSIAGGSPVRLYADDKHAQFAPSWSPDGEWIAFMQGIPGRMSLVKMRVGSSEAPTVLVASADYFQPQWSPDSAWLTYLDRDGVHLISSDGKTSRPISRTPWLTGGWSLDGKTLYSIRSNENRRLLVTSTDVATGQETVISDAGFAPVLNTDSVFAGFTLNPDGKSFTTSVLRSSSDLWILENFDSTPRSLFWFLKDQFTHDKKAAF